MSKLVYDIKDKPKFSQLIVLALQQLLAILAATIAVPTIIGLPTQIPAAILGNFRCWCRYFSLSVIHKIQKPSFPW